jgi:tryptophanyl-tRNA synthetase
MYPVHQAADITIVKANTVPVGDDQLPVIEQTNEIVRAFNRIYSCNILVEAQAVIAQVARLPGVDGSMKMSKSLGNAIFLSDTPDVVAKKVVQMYTDPQHIHVADPGRIEGNTVFTYLDIFGTDTARIAQMKEHYQRGGLGDVVVKKYLIEVLNTFLEPIRMRRAEFAQDRAYVKQLLLDGSAATYEVAERTMQEVKEATHLIYT